MPELSILTKQLKQSGIRSASVQCSKLNGINLGQGICDLPVPETIKQAAYQAIALDKSQYSACEGVYSLRVQIAQKATKFNKIPVSAEQVLVGHGATGIFVCAVMALFNPGDEVICFEPFYGYHKNILDLKGITIKPVPIDLTHLTVDMQKVAAAITPKTRGVILCTPNNPTGKVFSLNELNQLADIAKQNDLFVITDEIYEYVTYPGYEHVSFASLPGCFERTVTISGFSKTYNMTGWRLGYALATHEIIEKMSLIQDYLYVCPATPLQYAVLDALAIDDNYYHQMAAEYLGKRDFVVNALRHMGFKVAMPQGAYYLLADCSALPFANDSAICQFLLEQAKVAAVPGSSFYCNPADGKNYIRFCFALSLDKLSAAMEQMQAALRTVTALA